jgi:hypothetical protein
MLQRQGYFLTTVEASPCQILNGSELSFEASVTVIVAARRDIRGDLDDQARLNRAAAVSR